ncbi:MAG: acylphosphatase [Pseudomonadota bacterium]
MNTQCPPCRRYLVTGKVQGVYYRASAYEVATTLGIAGHALNRSDGGVEVLACGKPEALSQLEAWLWQGPAHASVDQVIAQDVETAATLAGFRTGTAR